MGVIFPQLQSLGLDPGMFFFFFLTVVWGWGVFGGLMAEDGSLNTVNRFQTCGGLQLLSFEAGSFEAGVSARETAERLCSMSNLYVLNKASSLDPEGRS